MMQLQRDPPVLALMGLMETILDQKSQSHCSSRNSGSVAGTEGRWNCTCVHDLEGLCDSLLGWQSRQATSECDRSCTFSLHCKVSPSHSALSSSSESSLHRSFAQNKPSLSHTSSISKSESRSSIRSYSYDMPPAIPFTFTHYESKDPATEAIEQYRKTYTYPSLEKRLKRDSGVVGAGSLCSSCILPVSSHQIPMARIKPKLLVLGETTPLVYATTRPSFTKKKQPLRPVETQFVSPKSQTVPASQSPVTSSSSSPPPSTQPPSSTNLFREIWEVKSKHQDSEMRGGLREWEKDRDRFSLRYKPSDGRSLLSSHASEQMKLNPRPDPGTENEASQHRGGEEVSNVKWASRTFPSFVVCSLNNTPGKMTTKRGSVSSSSTPFTSKANSSCKSKRKNSLNCTSSSPHSLPFSSKSMPLIPTKTEFPSLLHRRSQVAFHGVQPGFRYETLCNEGAEQGSPPITVAGPWITTH